MTTQEMKQILFDKLQAENTYFTKSDISIKKHGNDYIIVIKDYEDFPFKMIFEYDDYFGFVVWVLSKDHEEIVFTNSKKDYDIETALIYLGYYIGTRF